MTQVQFNITTPTDWSIYTKQRIHGVMKQLIYIFYSSNQICTPRLWLATRGIAFLTLAIFMTRRFFMTDTFIRRSFLLPDLRLSHVFRPFHWLSKVIHNFEMSVGILEIIRNFVPPRSGAAVWNFDLRLKLLGCY